MGAIGDLSIRDILLGVATLIIAIADILMKITSAVIYVASGRDGAEWALQAQTSVNDASSFLVAQASSTYDTVTHTTLSEFASTVGDYSQHVGIELVALFNGLDGSTIADGLSPDAADSVAAAVQTAMSL